MKVNEPGWDQILLWFPQMVRILVLNSHLASNDSSSTSIHDYVGRTATQIARAMTRNGWLALFDRHRLVPTILHSYMRRLDDLNDAGDHRNPDQPLGHCICGRVRLL